MTYDNTNSGIIAKNTRKTQDNHPDITGSINVDGKDWWINGWLKTSKKDGSHFYSLSVKPKEARQNAGISQGGKSYREAPPADFSDLDF